MRLLFIAMVATCVVSGCLQAQDTKIKTVKDLVYGRGGDVDLKLDLTMPTEGKGPFPAVVCIHPGRWSKGNREWFSPATEMFAKNGFVAVTISYRLAPRGTFPAQIEDCKAAVRWLRANGDKYRIDPDRIGAFGASAGAHLAYLLGLTDGKADFEGAGGNPKQSSKVQAVAGMFGPTDLTADNWPDYVKQLFTQFIGGTIKEKPEAYRQASPITHVNKGAPPFLLFHGSKDDEVPIDQSEKLMKKLREAGASADLIVHESEGHLFSDEALRKSIERSINVNAGRNGRSRAGRKGRCGWEKIAP